jgi:hypothetical protein
MEAYLSVPDSDEWQAPEPRSLLALQPNSERCYSSLFDNPLAFSTSACTMGSLNLTRRSPTGIKAGWSSARIEVVG